MPPEPKIEKREIGRLHVRAEFMPQSINKEKRTVELTWSTGEKVRRSPWWGDPYYEELSMDPGSVRMKRLQSGRAPFLAAHNGGDLDAVIGVVQAASIENGIGRATVRFSKRAGVEDVFQDVCDGIMTNVSVGYDVRKYEDVSESDDKIRTYRATDWEPFEISLVPMGADSMAAIRQRSADKEEKTHRCEFILRADSASNQGEDMPPKEANQKQEGATAVREAAAEVKPVVPAAPAKTEGEIAVAERQRAKDIRSAAKLARLEDEFAEKLVDEGVTLDHARKAIFEEMEKRSKSQGSTVQRVEVGREPGDVLVKGATDALLSRFDSKLHKPTEEGRHFRGHSLMDLGREFLAVQGVSTRGLGKMELAGAMLQKRAGLHDTTDFPSLLANVANKTLRQAYEYAPKTYEPLTRYTEAPDFKPIQRTQLGDAPTLVKVGEGGEITYGTIGDAKEVYTLATYARIIAITRQVLINDDLNAFTRIPSQYGIAAAQLQSDLVWLQLTSNPNMGDSIALFHASHGNLGSAGAISVTTLGAGRAAMRLQTGLNGMKINLQPKYLVVPTALETLADQYVTSQFLANQPSATNPFAGRMQVITEPRLDTASASNWYMAADPSQIDMLEMAFLQGQQGVYVETKIGFDVDGVEMKARLDCAAKVIDWRGFWKNPN